MERLPDYSEWLTPERLDVEEAIWADHPNNALMSAAVAAMFREYGLASMVEFGCGTGWVPFRLGGAVEYLGVDKNPHCLAKARAKNPDRTFVLADVREFEPVSKDLVCALSFLKHLNLDEWGVLFRKLIGMGKYSCFTMSVSDRDLDDGVDFPHTWVSRDTIARGLSDVGHEVLSSEVIWEAANGKEWLFRTGARS